MAFLRSVIHLLWMGITVVPYALAIMLGTLLGVRGLPLYRIARAWLSLCISGARVVLGIRAEVTGMENLPQGANEGAILLVKSFGLIERNVDVEWVSLPLSVALVYIPMPIAGLAVILQAVVQIIEMIGGKAEPDPAKELAL